MTEPYAVVQCCERVEAAVSDGDPATLRRRLRELADLLAADELGDPAFGEVRDDATSLAERATDHDRTATDLDLGGAALPDEFRREVTTLTHRVCRCYLRVAEVPADSLPAFDGEDPDAAAAAVEQLADDHAELDAETAIWAARAKALATERTAALDALERVADAVAEVERGWSPDLESMVEDERAAQRRFEALEEKADQLHDEE